MKMKKMTVYQVKLNILTKYGITVDEVKGWCRKAKSLAAKHLGLDSSRYIDFMYEMGWKTII